MTRGAPLSQKKPGLPGEWNPVEPDAQLGEGQRYS